jgi:signal transduction histidine kinase
VRFVAVVGCLAGAAMAVLILAAVAAVRANLIRQADLRLQIAAASLGSRAVLSGLNPGPAAQDSRGLRVEVLGAAGQGLMPVGWGTAGGPPGPAVPLRPAWLSAHAGRLITLPARSGGQSWRVIVRPVHYRARRILYTYGANDFTLTLTSRTGTGRPAVLVVGVDLTGISRTTGRLALAGLAACVLVALAVAGLAAALIRGSIRRSLTAVLRRAAPPAPGAGPGAAARDRAEQLRRSLAGSAAELRGPLNVISGFAGSYRRHGTPAAGDDGHMMRRIEVEAARMAAAVDALEAGVTAPGPDTARTGENDDQD